MCGFAYKGKKGVLVFPLYSRVNFNFKLANPTFIFRHFIRMLV